MESEKSSAAGWIVGLLIVAAIVGLLLVARGPEDQDRSGAVAPTATLIQRA
jgi:hypothetical protein